MSTNEPTSNGSSSGNGKIKRKWYKDRTYLFMIGVFALAGCILFIQAQQQQFNKAQQESGVQLLIGQNKTLILVNKTAAVVLGDKPVVEEGSNKVLEQVKNLLVDVNKTISNPNRTISTKPG